MVSFYMVIEWFIIHIIYLDMFIRIVIDALIVYWIEWFIDMSFNGK